MLTFGRRKKGGKQEGKGQKETPCVVDSVHQCEACTSSAPKHGIVGMTRGYVYVYVYVCVSLSVSSSNKTAAPKEQEEKSQYAMLVMCWLQVAAARTLE